MRHYADRGVTAIRHYADRGVTTIRHYADRGVVTMRNYAVQGLTSIRHYTFLPHKFYYAVLYSSRYDENTLLYVFSCISYNLEI